MTGKIVSELAKIPVWRGIFILAVMKSLLLKVVD